MADPFYYLHFSKPLNMKSNIELIPTRDMSYEQWLQFRKGGIGASEVGVILGLSPYKASIQLFYEKIGEGLDMKPESLPAFLGKEQEDFIALMWEFWEGDTESMMRNYREGRKVRRCKKVNAYARNPKYPWLFVSLDREINQTPTRGNGSLELKTIGGYSADQWEAGFPPGYVVQIMDQCGVCEYDYGESAILKDNRDFFVLPFEFDLNIFNTILNKTEVFWKSVVKARMILTKKFEAERTFNGRAVEELSAELAELEPAPDGSDAFNAFLKEKYSIALPGERPGTLEDEEDARAHKEASGRIKEVQETKQLHENRLKNRLGHENADRLDFGKSGYISWKSDSNGVRRFLNKVK